MSFKEMAPWRWGGLRSKKEQHRPLESLKDEMETFQSNIDRIFSDFFSGESVSKLMRESWGSDELFPKLNETEDDKAFHISAELPGMDEKDVELTLADGVLTIRGEKKEDEEEKGKDFYRRERNYGSICRKIALPADVDESKVEACFKKGVLNIKLPKSEEAQKKVKRIDVKAA